MKERNFELFFYLKWKDLPRFKAEVKLTFEDIPVKLTEEDIVRLKLTPEKVARLTPEEVAAIKLTPQAFARLIPGDIRLRHREALLHYGRRNSPQPFLGYEYQDYCVLHEAIRLRFYEAVEFILVMGGDLLQTEEINNAYYTREDWGAELQIRDEKIVLPTALDLIVESGDKKLIQIAFDHLCKKKLYLEHKDKPEYLQFIYDHFWDLKSPHFTARCLCFDVGRPLPSPFVSAQHLKEYLVDRGLDVRGIFFTVEDYLDLDYISEPLLSRALSVCQFSLDDLRRIYNVLKLEELKLLVVSHNPDVAPEFAAKLNLVPKVVERKQQDEKEETAPKPKSSSDAQTKKLVAPEERAEFNMKVTRIKFLESKIGELKKKEKNKKRSLSEEERSQLEDYQAEKRAKQDWLDNNSQSKKSDSKNEPQSHRWNPKLG